MSNHDLPRSGNLTSLFAVFSADGEDAQSFLQAQLTCDVKALTPGSAQLGAYLTPKGRVLAVLVVIARASGYLLLTHPSVLPALLARLRLYVLRSRVTLAERPELAVAGTFETTTGRADGDLSRLPVTQGEPLALPWPGGRTLRVGPVAEVDRDPQPGFLQHWLAADVRQGLAHVREETADRHVAQMLDLDLIGGVSFRKGCFPGQEIVARAHYLGRVKRRLGTYTAPRPLPPAEGLLDPEGRSIGEVLFSGTDAQGTHWTLAVVTADRAGEAARTAEGEVLMPKGLVHEIANS